jgi:hypothetical protein
VKVVTVISGLDQLEHKAKGRDKELDLSTLISDGSDGITDDGTSLLPIERRRGGDVGRQICDVVEDSLAGSERLRNGAGVPERRDRLVADPALVSSELDSDADAGIVELDRPMPDGEQMREVLASRSQRRDHDSNMVEPKRQILLQYHVNSL